MYFQASRTSQNDRGAGEPSGDSGEFSCQRCSLLRPGGTKGLAARDRGEDKVTGDRKEGEAANAVVVVAAEPWTGASVGLEGVGSPGGEGTGAEQVAITRMIPHIV
jgi:hypothetical protein